MRKLAVAGVTLVLATTILAVAQTRKTLDIYLIDVEGGNSTLFVSPSGESLLIDTGNGGAAAVRDGDRIMAAVKDAGLSQINHLITTHWHGDHFGAMENVAGRIPIREFLDHGANVQPGGAIDEFLQKTYPALYAKAKHTVVKPGDKVADRRPRLAHRRGGGRGDQELAVRRRQAESVLRRVQAAGRRPHARTRSRSAATSRSASFACCTWAI